MAGKNRMIVNFSSKKLRDLIVEIAKKNHMSQSKVIEKLVSFRLFESNEDPVVYAFSDASKAVMGQQQKDDSEFSIALSTPYIKHNARLYKVSGELSGKGSININHVNAERLNAVSLEKELRKKLKRE